MSLFDVKSWKKPSSVIKENHEMYEVIEKSDQTGLYFAE